MKFLISIILIILISPKKPLFGFANAADSVNFAILHPVVDIQKVARIENLTITRDQGVYHLYKGKFYFAKAIYGQHIMAVFVGNGIFRMTPATSLEKEHLVRVKGITNIEQPFTTLFLAFTDTTFQEITRSVVLEYEEPSDDITEYLEVSARYLGDKNSNYIERHWGFMADVLNEQKKGFFYSLITSRSPSSLLNGTLGSWNDDPVIFMINPYEEEEVKLLRRLRYSGTGFYQETISQFHNKQYLQHLSSEKADLIARYNVDRYLIEIKVENDLSIRAKAALTVNPRERINWLNFDLYYKLHVDSVKVNGQNAQYFRPLINDEGFEQWTSAPLWIKTDNGLKNFERTEVIIFYHGEVVGREYDQVFLKASDDWYPVHDMTRKQKHSFDITFNYPKTYKIVSLGTGMETKDGNKNCSSRWTTEHPVRHCTFNIGLFKEFSFKNDQIPELHIVHRYDRDVKTLKSQVLADIANSYAYYQNIFGSRPLHSLYVAEHPYSHSEAYPGLINLWWRAFQSDWSSGDDELIRAHEVAHQWWGINLDFETYHDQWLSEAFAEYAAMMYVQQSLKDNDEFFRMLKEAKERIISNRKSMMSKLVGDNQQAGPIWLGYRTSSSSSEGDYGLIIYEKGMWVLHMLRNMMIDLNTMNEDRYLALMRDFYESYSGKYASTRDFKSLCDKHFSSDMSWFFDQWVYGTNIPKYEFSYKVFPVQNQKYKIRCKVKQLNVDESFKMLIPVTIEFEGHRFARMRIVVQGQGGEFDLPLMPLEPKNVIFNDFESVLCEVDNVLWKD